ncbi:MAG: hypothetical protein R2839_04810 [Thermomicrobiales bacterium]
MKDEVRSGNVRGGLLVDRYHIDSVFVSWRTGHNPMVTFDLYTRKLPFGGAHLLVKGWNQRWESLRTGACIRTEIDTCNRPAITRDFLEELAHLQGFTGSINAIREGEIAFANEPLMRVTASFREALMLESAMLHTIGVSTLDRHQSQQTGASGGWQRRGGVRIAGEHRLPISLPAQRLLEVVAAHRLSTRPAGMVYQHRGRSPCARRALSHRNGGVCCGSRHAAIVHSLLLDTYDVVAATGNGDLGSAGRVTTIGPPPHVGSAGQWRPCR